MQEVVKMLTRSLQNDPHLHLYAVGESPYASPLDVQSTTFGTGGDRIDIVDSFRGRRPFLLNRDSLAAQGDYPLRIMMTLILDSHVASRLHDYRTGRDAARPGRRAATEDFLLFASQHRVDYNPVFYMTESQAKSAPQDFIDYVAPVLTSILYLHSMDEDHFVDTRQMRLKPDAVDHYLGKYGGRTFEDCGEIWVRRMIRDRAMLAQFLAVRASYVCLLKLVLIHKRSRRPVLEKVEKFERFLADDLKCYMGRESHLALYYFADLILRLLPVQRSSNFDNAKSRLLATAWDLWLLRIPELLLNPYEHPIMNLAYVCSAEQELTQVGKFFGIEWMGVRSDDHTIIGPMLSLDLSALESRLGRDAVRSLMSRSPQAPRHDKPAALTGQDLSGRVEALVARLEGDLQDFLQA